MSNVPELLTPTEAAVVARVSIRDVNRVIDESILPDDFVSVRDGRQIAAAGCPLIAFYFESAKRLTAEERLWAIRIAAPRLRESPSLVLLEEDWTFKDEFLTIDLEPFVRRARERLVQLEEARTTVVSSTEILNGTPVFRGTRVPVYDVAASLAAGVPIDRLLVAYPSLDANRLELAAIYAEANPLRGRPRSSLDLPEGAKIITDRRLSRRRHAT